MPKGNAKRDTHNIRISYAVDADKTEAKSGNVVDRTTDCKPMQ